MADEHAAHVAGDAYQCCTVAAAGTANQALHAHATELSDKLVAAEAEVVGLRAECKQLRQGTAAAAANAASPHSAEVVHSGP